LLPVQSVFDVLVWPFYADVTVFFLLVSAAFTIVLCTYVSTATNDRDADNTCMAIPGDCFGFELGRFKSDLLLEFLSRFFVHVVYMNCIRSSAEREQKYENAIIVILKIR
jgi:hypothetical protein